MRPVRVLGASPEGGRWIPATARGVPRERVRPRASMAVPHADPVSRPAAASTGRHSSLFDALRLVIDLPLSIDRLFSSRQRSEHDEKADTDGHDRTSP